MGKADACEQEQGQLELKMYETGTSLAKSSIKLA
jgi:hypothetical protein